MSFQKRQKELARKEKQRMKAERRAQRKAEGGLPPSPDDEFDHGALTESETAHTSDAETPANETPEPVND